MQNKSTNRIAVASFFFVNGFLYANWTSRLPAVQQFLGISNALLGTLLFVMAIGAVVAMPFSGWLTTRFGSRKITSVCGLISCVLIMLFSMWQSVWFVGIIFLLLGISNGAMDVAMNGQAVYVEREWGKPIMSSFHAVFSVGMALGAAVGALFAKYNMALSTHFLGVSVLGILALLIASPYLVRDKPADTAVEDATDGHFSLPTRAILPLGIIAFCCMMGEGSMADWSAIYLHKVIGANDFYAAFAIGSFSVAMTIGRTFGDYFTMRLGKQKLLILDSLLAIIGLSIVLFFHSIATALLGFFCIGLGLATVVPIVYSTAGNTEGVAPSVGIAMATTIGYAGFFVGPPVIGFLSDAFGLRVGLGATLAVFVLMAFVVARTRFVDRHRA